MMTILYVCMMIQWLVSSKLSVPSLCVWTEQKSKKFPTFFCVKMDSSFRGNAARRSSCKTFQFQTSKREVTYIRTHYVLTYSVGRKSIEERLIGRLELNAFGKRREELFAAVAAIATA